MRKSIPIRICQPPPIPHGPQIRFTIQLCRQIQPPPATQTAPPRRSAHITRPQPLYFWASSASESSRVADAHDARLFASQIRRTRDVSRLCARRGYLRYATHDARLFASQIRRQRRSTQRLFFLCAPAAPQNKRPKQCQDDPCPRRRRLAVHTASTIFPIHNSDLWFNKFR